MQIIGKMILKLQIQWHEFCTIDYREKTKIYLIYTYLLVAFCNQPRIG